MRASLLVEIQTEELPPKALKTLCGAFAAGIESGLRTRGFVSEQSVMTVYGTPRRLAVHLTSVAKKSAESQFRHKLLPVAIGLDAHGKATPALKKKLAAIGVEANVKKLKHESDGKQDVLVYEGEKPGELLISALQPVIEETIAALPIPKMMSYQLADGETTTQFVRPAHRLIAMHGHAVVPVHALGLAVRDQDAGSSLPVQGTLAVLCGRHVCGADAGRRLCDSVVRRAPRERSNRCCSPKPRRHDAEPVVPDELLDEVTALVEWPVVYESSFDAEYLSVPPECLILTMQQNQKYFALNDRAGELTNRFLLVSNIEASDGGDAIRAGNARVVRARLADAKFFYDQDRKQTLESRVAGPGAGRLSRQARLTVAARRAHHRDSGRHRERARRCSCGGRERPRGLPRPICAH